MPSPKPSTAASPLYTTLKSRSVKLSLAREWGPDTDGAYRTRNRLDGKDKQPRAEHDDRG